MIRINEIELNKFYEIEGVICIVVYLDSLINDRVFKAITEKGTMLTGYITAYSNQLIKKL